MWSGGENRMKSNRLWLQQLCNKFGDFKVAKSWKENGKICWSKHRSVMKCWESERGLNFLDVVNHRQIMPAEIVIDIDEKPTLKRFNGLCDFLDIMKIKYYGYDTGSKGYHIHIWDKKLTTSRFSKKELRQTILQDIIKIKVDMQLKSGNHMVAIENMPHWKTGNKKRLLRKWYH